MIKAINSTYIYINIYTHTHTLYYLYKLISAQLFLYVLLFSVKNIIYLFMSLSLQKGTQKRNIFNVIFHFFFKSNSRRKTIHSMSFIKSKRNFDFRPLICYFSHPPYSSLLFTSLPFCFTANNHKIIHELFFHLYV